MLHTIAVCQARDPGPGRVYYQRKLDEGKTRAEARRALKRRLANVLYRRMRGGPTARTTYGCLTHRGAIKSCLPGRCAQPRGDGQIHRKTVPTSGRRCTTGSRHPAAVSIIYVYEPDQDVTGVS